MPDAAGSGESIAAMKDDLQPDMVVLADAFRLDRTSRILLTAFDARTLEDFAMMTDRDYDNMVVTGSRTGLDISPLQNRKICVLRDWVRNLVMEGSVLLSGQAGGYNGAGRSGSIAEKGGVEALYGNVPLVPSNWESRFQHDLPKLKQSLWDMGESTHWSTYAPAFQNIKWVFCLG